MPDTEITFIVCKNCNEETEPSTLAEYEAIAAVNETTGNITHGRCRRCRNLLFTLIDHGMVDFGDE